MRAILLLLFFCVSVIGCRASKADSCSKTMARFDPVVKELEAAQAAAPATPSPDADSCAKLETEARAVEGAQVKLSLLVAGDDELEKRLKRYREQVDGWAKAAKAAHVSCVTRDGNAMTKAVGDAIRHRAQLAPAAADVTAYCREP